MPTSLAPVLIFPGDIDSTIRERNPPDYACRLLAEGDSWFSFGSWRLQSLPQHLRFSRDTIIVTLAEPGDTINRMSNIAKNPALAMQLSNAFGCRWDAILLSGGGNDLIDNAGAIIPASARQQSANKAAEDYCNLNVLRGTLNAVARGYAAIVELRDRPKVSPCVGKPIIIHTYDHCTPREAPARFAFITLGPWLFPAMQAARIPPGRWNDVADFIMDALAERLLGLEQTLPNFHVVETRGATLRAAAGAKGTSNDSENEIHLTKGGCRKVAARISARLETLLP